MATNTKLIDEYPRLVLPTLAMALGRNGDRKAMFLQQVYFLIQNAKQPIVCGFQAYFQSSPETW